MAGVRAVWIFLPPGSSKKFLRLKNLMKTGNIKNVIKNAVPPTKKNCSINLKVNNELAD